MEFSLQEMELVVGLGERSIQTLQKLPSVLQSTSVLQRAALFIAIFSARNVREPEVFADLILYIHTLKTLVALNHVNLQRLPNWARSLPITGFLVALHLPLSPSFQGGIGHVVECSNRKKMFRKTLASYLV